MSILLILMPLAQLPYAMAQESPAAVLAGEAGESWVFDLPGMPLHDALQRYTELTGQSVLYATDGARLLQSAPVRGHYTAAEGLARIIAGTGLSVRYMTERMVSLVPASRLVGTGRAAAAPQALASQGNLAPAVRQRYYTLLRAGVLDLLCADPRIELGSYRLVLQFRITAIRVMDVEKVIVVGNGSQEALVRAALTGQRVPAPPDGLAQPITMLLTPPPRGRLEVCAR